MHYRIYSHALETLAAEGEGLIVSYDYNREQKAPIPEAIRQRIEALEGEVFVS